MYMYIYYGCFSYAYETALNESIGLQSPILVTEYGCGADADERLAVPTIEAQDRAMISALIWPWKNNCYQPGCESSWSLYDSGTLNGTFATQNGPERPNRVRILSRIHPRGVVGQLKQYFHNTTTSSFTMTADCTNKTILLSNNETIIYIPRRLNSSVVNVTGEAKLLIILKNPDESRLALINPTCNGKYYVFIANNTNQLENLYRQTTNMESKSHREMMQTKKNTYELVQLLHNTAIKIGETFAATSSKFTTKVPMISIIEPLNETMILYLVTCITSCRRDPYETYYTTAEKISY